MLLAMCSCSAEPSSDAGAKSPDPTPYTTSNSKPIAPYDSVKIISWARVANSALGTSALEYIMLNFGLKVEEKLFSSQNMSDNILRLYAADISPELATGISVETVKTLAQGGYLSELFGLRDSLEDYFALWEDDENAWEYTKKDICVSSSDGAEELYCLVPVNRKASRAWIYNKTLFDENSMQFPSTLTELYDTLSRYKEKHSTSGAVWTNRYDALQFTAILNAYGLTDDVWQTDENGNVFFLYAQKEWYQALEWLTKFEKLGAVPVDKNGRLTSLGEKEYSNATSGSQQIIEFTDSYNYLYIQSKQKGSCEWAVADVMIAADDYTTPVLSANVPYINEATCISSYASEAVKKQILAFINWCCTNDGNMWANFGCKGDGYTINDAGEFVFLKYYSDEMTPNISKKDSGSISDITVGRMFTTVPWDKINISGVSNRYSAEEAFLQNAKLRLVYPERFGTLESVTEDKTMLWEYVQIRSNLEKLAEDFEEYSRQNGFSEYFWNKYYNSLLEAGLEEYTAIMQKRKL